MLIIHSYSRSRSTQVAASIKKLIDEEGVIDILQLFLLSFNVEFTDTEDT